MSQSKYDYVKNYEFDVLGKCLPNCWVIVKISGKAFTKFSEAHGYIKPNDARGLNLMNRAATVVMEEHRDISFAYGHSDEYNFVFRKDTSNFDRRSDKFLSAVNSLFSAGFVFHWPSYFSHEIQYPPSFDSQVYLFPNDRTLRDYVNWRQLQHHSTNLSNTAFWALVLKKGLSKNEAESRLHGRFFIDKYEQIFSEVGTNYNNEPEMYRRGTILLRKLCPHPSTGKLQHKVVPFHSDLVNDGFWKEHPEVIGLKSLQIYNKHPEGNEKRMRMDPSSQEKQTQDKYPDHEM